MNPTASPHTVNTPSPGARAATPKATMKTTLTALFLGTILACLGSPALAASFTVPSGAGTFNLPNGKSVTIIYSVTVNASLVPASTLQVTDQGTVTGVFTGAPLSTNTVITKIIPTVTANAATLAVNATTMTIAGDHFDASTPGNNVVTFSNGTGTVTAATTTQLTVTSLSGLVVGSLTASVSVSGTSSGAGVQVATVIPVVTSSAANLASNAPSMFINGFGFSTTAANNVVSFVGGATGTVTTATATKLTVTSLTGLTLGVLNASVTTSTFSSGAAVQVATIVNPPTVTLNTANLAKNATLLIAGTGFDTTAANNTVALSSGATGNVTAATATQLTVTFTTQPTSLGSLTTVVTTDGGSSGAAVQVANIVNPPTVTLTTTNRAKNAPTVIITGTGFDTTAANNTVVLTAGAAGTVTLATATSLTVTFTTQPTSTGSMTAVVTTDGGSSGAAVQVATIVNPPTVTTTTTNVGQNAATFVITGTNFDSTTPANNTVVLNLGAAGNVTAATATSLTVTFSTQPTSLGNMTAVVTTDGGSSGAAVQVATIIPVITVSAANLAANATTLTINGFGFDPTPGNNVLTFSGGVTGTISTATANTLNITGLSGLIANNLTASVTVNGTSSGAPVQVATVIPVVTASAAQFQIGTATLVINGFGFDTTAGNNTVVFNLGGAGSVTSASATSLTVTFGTQPTAGVLTAVVTTNGKSSGAAVQVATSVALSITSSTANLLNSAATLIINGSGFSTTLGNDSVTFNLGAVGNVTAATTSQMTVTFSTTPTSLGALNATVTVVANGSTGPTQVATVVATPPAVGTPTVLPGAAIEGASTAFTVSGTFTDFGNGAEVPFTVVVNWGDSNTDTATVSGGSNPFSYSFSGNHTYAEEGAFNVTISVTNKDSATGVSSATVVTVSDAALTGGAFTPPVATEGVAFSNVTVFHFTDADPAGIVSDYSALITWGDGSTDTVTSTPSAAGKIVVNGGGFDVQGSHTYAEELTNATFSVLVTDAGGASTSASTAAFNVADAALTAGAFTPPAATEGAPFSNVVVFHFTDADPAGTASDYSALITWGDGNTDTVTSTPSAAGKIVANGGGFDVQGSHTYAEELTNATFSVLVTDAGGATASASTATFNVADAALTAGAFTPPVATEGASFSNVTLFHFTDADPAGTASDYSALITWGDGNTDTVTSTPSAAGKIIANGGGFDVLGSHTYSEELSNATFSIAVTDAGGATSSASTAAFSVADSALTAGAFTPPVATEGASFSNVTVFHFTDADPAGTASDYSALITWGDGNTDTVTSTPSAAGKIVANGGGFDVQGSHTYAEELTNAIFSVAVTDAGGAAASASTSTFNVADAALTAGALTPPVATEGAALNSVTVFHFTDANPAGAASDYSALITWGDGNTDTVTSTPSAAGQIVANGGGGFDVQGSHTYAEELTNATFSVSVTDAGGAATSASTSTFSVADAALTAGAFTPPVATEGVALSNVTVFHFTDADPAGAASDYTATITWGDGGSSAGLIVANGGGFDVQGSHTYAEELTNQTFSVVVTDIGGATISASTGVFSVADAALTAGALTPPVTTEGAANTNVMLFHFTDANPAATASDYSALITWGDGNTDMVTSTPGAAGQIVANGGGFDVQGSHSYAEELTNATFSVAITDAGGATTSASISTYSVADAALTAGALTPPVATEGAPNNNVTVFHFTDANPLSTASDFTGTITWGDGNLSAGTIVANGGGFDVLGSHTYAEELTNVTFSVLVTDAGGASTSASIATFSVADAALTAGALTPPVASEGTPFSNVAVFHFTDANPASTASDFSALITWGDGNTDTVTSTPGAAGQIVANGGGFDVQGSHTYAQSSPSLTFSVAVTDLGGSTTNASTTFSVANLPPVVSTPVVSPTIASEGAASNFSVSGTFTDPAGALDQPFTAVVDWGDSSTDTVTVSGGGNPFSYAFNGNHTYAEEGVYNVIVSVTDKDGGVGTSAATLVTVSDPQITSLASANLPANAVEGTPLAAIAGIATFTDPAGAEAVSDYTTVIHWGDTTTSTGTVVSLGGGNYRVDAPAHTYSEEGSFSVTTTVTHDLLAALTSPSQTIVVADAALTPIGVTFAAAEGQIFSGKVAAFTDGNPTSPLGDFSASIDWGDATPTSAGTIAQPGGIGTAFTVSGTHTYAEENNSYPVTVVITDAGGSSATANSTANVSDPGVAATGGFTFTAGAGVSTGNQTVATFTDPGGPEALGDYSASIDWGDGSIASSGTITLLSGVFTVQGAHTFAQAGTNTITATIQHDSAPVATATSNATVLSIILAPATLPAGTVGVGYSQTIVASGAAAPYTFKSSGAMPQGLTLSAGGVISGTPAAAGTFNITVTATDASTGSGPYSGSQAYTLTINPNVPPTISAAVAITSLGARPAAPQVLAANVALTGSTVSFSVSATDPDDAINFSWNFGDGTPTAAGTTTSQNVAPIDFSKNVVGNTSTHAFAKAGNYTVTVTASDAVGGTVTSSVMVSVDTPPQISSGPTVLLDPVSMDVAETFTVAPQDADGDKLSYTWNFGEPAGAATVPPNTPGVLVQSDNNTTGDNSNAMHTYLSQFANLYTAGSNGTITINATLTIDDNHGGTVTAPVQFTLINPVNTAANAQVIDPGTGVSIQTIGGTGGIFTFIAGQAFDPAAAQGGQPPPLNTAPLPSVQNATIVITTPDGTTQSILGSSFTASLSVPGIYEITVQTPAGILAAKEIAVTADQLKGPPTQGFRFTSKSAVAGTFHFNKGADYVLFVGYMPLTKALPGGTHTVDVGVGNIIGSTSFQLNSHGTSNKTGVLKMSTPGTGGLARFKADNKRMMATIHVYFQLHNSNLNAGFALDGATQASTGKQLTFDQISGKLIPGDVRLAIQALVMIDDSLVYSGPVPATWKVTNTVGHLRKPK